MKYVVDVDGILKEMDDNTEVNTVNGIHYILTEEEKIARDNRRLEETT